MVIVAYKEDFSGPTRKQMARQPLSKKSKESVAMIVEIECGLNVLFATSILSSPRVGKQGSWPIIEKNVVKK